LKNTIKIYILKFYQEVPKSVPNQY